MMSNPMAATPHSAATNPCHTIINNRIRGQPKYHVICDDSWGFAHYKEIQKKQHQKDIDKSYLEQIMLRKFYLHFYDLYLPHGYNIPNCPVILNLYELFEPTVPFDDLTNIVDRHHAVRKPVAHHWVFHYGSQNKSGLQTHRIWFKSLDDMIMYRTA
ncbi:MAG: hypothetical protein EOP45_22175, partial [Sphingobacteriaceae bacterium]